MPDAQVANRPSGSDDSSRALRSLRIRGAVFCALGILLLAVMLGLRGHRDVMLLVAGTSVEATVVDDAQESQNALGGPGEHTVTYTFAAGTAGGVTGIDVLPGASVAPRLGESVEVEYLAAWPTVNRLSSQVSTTPLIGFFMGILVLVSGIRILAALRETQSA